MIPRRSKIFTKNIINDILTYVFLASAKKKDYTALFESICSGYLGVKYAALTPSGRKGLELVLEYFGFPKNSEIILPAYTLKAIPVIIKDMGYAPIFIDIDPESCNINADLIEDKITEKTSLILATHLFGLPCKIDKILEIAQKRNLKVIEDCAHSLGATYKNKKLGTFGEASFFSLEFTKPINTFGGGIVVTNNKNIYKFIKERVSLFYSSREKIIFKVIFPLLEDTITHSPLYSILGFLFYYPFTKKLFFDIGYRGLRKSINAPCNKYSNFQAFLGYKSLSFLDEKNALLIAKLWQFRNLLDKGIRYPQADYPHSQAFYFNLVRTNNNCDLIRRALLRQGIDSGIRDEISDHCPLYFGLTGDYPVADAIYNSLIQLPLSSDFDKRTINFIADRLNKVFAQKLL